MVRSIVRSCVLVFKDRVSSTNYELRIANMSIGDQYIQIPYTPSLNKHSHPSERSSEGCDECIRDVQHAQVIEALAKLTEVMQNVAEYMKSYLERGR